MHFRTWRSLFLGLPLLLLLPFALAACGGDDDDGGGSGGGGSDREFVADICAAGRKFSEDFTEGFAEIDLAEADEDEIKDAIVEPFKDFAKAFEDANPPDDLEDWHKDATKEFNNLVEDIEDSEGLEALENVDESPIPEPPADAVDRLQKIADENEDCQEANFNFDE